MPTTIPHTPQYDDDEHDRGDCGGSYESLRFWGVMFLIMGMCFVGVIGLGAYKIARLFL